MPLGTLDSTPPPFFRQGPSALSKLVFYSALAIFLMAADTRFQLTPPLRSGLATVLYPAQWLAQQPTRLLGYVGDFFTTVDGAKSAERAVRQRLAEQAVRAVQADELRLENQKLRQLLGLRPAITSPVQVAEVLYDAADVYSRKVILDRGLAQQVALGSGVMDEAGVIGQVTRVYPLVSEVTLLTDRDQAIPVLNTRTGARSVAYGDPAHPAGPIELRFMGANADVTVGDLLTTSGVDGVYPAGLPVARVSKIERRADTAFASIHCTPVAAVESARHVMVINPVAALIAPRPVPDAAAPVGNKRPGAGQGGALGRGGAP